MPSGQEDSLEVLTSYASSVEAGFSQQILEEAGITARLGGESTATALSYVGTALGGVKLLVRKEDLTEAAQILSAHPDLDEAEFIKQGEAEGWWEGDPDEPEEIGTEKTGTTEPSRELLRAYRGAIFGLALFPFGVWLFSLYMIFRHRLFLSDRGGNDWRFFVAMLMNVMSVYFAKLLWEEFRLQG